MRRNNHTTLEEAYEEWEATMNSPSHEHDASSLYNDARPFFRERAIRGIEGIEVRDCREYAKDLSRRVSEDELSKRTAIQYYSMLRSWLRFCRRDEMIDKNPADTIRAEEPLPEKTGYGSDQQFWNPAIQNAVINGVDEIARESTDQLDELGWAPAFRNRGITYVYRYTGARANEILAKAGDPERNGITWRDVNFDDGTVKVLGKKRDHQWMQLPAPAAKVLAEYKQILEPETDEWPVFPSDGPPQLYAVARDQLNARGFTDQEIESLLNQKKIYTVFRENYLTPPSVTSNGWKHGFWYDFVDERNLRIDGERLELHAARRGLGDELYRDDPTTAQSALRHEDPRTTHKKYSNIRASETADAVNESLNHQEPEEFL